MADTFAVVDGAFHKKANVAEGRPAEWAIVLRVGKRRQKYMLGVSGPSEKTTRKLVEWLGFEVDNG